MEAKNWKTEKETIIRCVLLNLAGVFIYAVGINSFAAPHKIAPGGASGIAILINYLTGCPIGLFVFVFNIPLLLIIVVKKYFPVLPEYFCRSNSRSLLDSSETVFSALL